MASNSLFLPQPIALLVPKPEPKLEPFDDISPLPAAAVPPAYNRLSELFLSSFQSNLQQDAGSDPAPNSRAIVPVPNPGSQNLDAVPPPPTDRRNQARSSELVRITDLKPEDHRFYRDRVRKVRMLYDSLRVSGIASDGTRSRRDDMKSAALMNNQGLWLNRDKRIVGSIPGIAIGDIFFFRAELCVLGLHGPPQAGIDFLPSSQSSNGEPIATSIIVSGGYEDDFDAGDVLIYSGHGGQDKQSRQVADQKLEGGNLALERSMVYGVEVRVIRGVKTNCGKVYVYDGLYKVIHTWFDAGKSGFGVFKYRLVRFENHFPLGSSIIKFAANLGSQPLNLPPKGYLTLDLSSRKEQFPVFLYNDLDQDNDPLFHEYLVSTIFPSYLCYNKTSIGCNCVGGCLEGCFCAMRNGGQFAYESNGTLVRGKPLIFECGPNCRCPPGCRNRVSQRGIKSRFEVFRSRETGWGVRSLDVIQAGSFICEYAGVVLTREQARVFTMNGDSLVYPGCFAERWKEWGDLSAIFPRWSSPNYPSIPPLDFALDVSRMRNVACYMSHSTSPNVMVQPVLYDHDNVSFPRLMLFAMENIPPMRELSLDYGVADECTTGKLAIGH